MSVLPDKRQIVLLWTGNWLDMERRKMNFRETQLKTLVAQKELVFNAHESAMAWNVSCAEENPLLRFYL